MRNEKLNINTPQMVFDSRIDGLIDIAGFTRLTEKVVWQALEKSGLVYQDWSVRKESGEVPLLHIYIEPKPGSEIPDEETITTMMHDQLKDVDSDYASLESMLDLKPLKVTILPPGTFKAYMEKQRASGADLAHLKIPHINPTEKQIDSLLVPAAEV